MCVLFPLFTKTKKNSWTQFWKFMTNKTLSKHIVTLSLYLVSYTYKGSTWALNTSFKELLEFLRANGKMLEQYPLMSSLREYCASILMRAVDYEKSFSCLNLIKNIGNRLSVYVSNILMINIKVTEKKLFKFEDAFIKWANM